MRVVHVITGLAAGGAEQVLYDVATRSQHDVAVIALSTDGLVGQRLRDRGVEVHVVGMGHNRDLGVVLRLAKLLRRLDPDVVHVHLYRALLYGRLAARMVGIRAILATEHSALPTSTEGRDASRLVRLLYRLAERLGTLTIAVSHTTKNVLVKSWSVPEKRITVVPNGVDLARLAISSSEREQARSDAGIPSTARVIMSSGRMVPGKRFDEAVRSFAALAEESSDDVRLLLVGDGPERPALETLAKDLCVRHVTTFVGEVADVRPYLALADVFLSLSVVETYGIAIVEAYAAGLPVVFRQSPAIDDLPEGTDATRLVRCDDGDDREVARALDTALRQPVGGEHLAAGLLDRFDVDSVAREIDRLQEWSASPHRSPALPPLPGPYDDRDDHAADECNRG